ncbi:MAG: TIR domain-containing protein [Nitrospira sp.]|nr:TIR domain-containing protein [Nitrospira sp.]MCY4132109.1 TIR domain-containing protein [Nitrospira sp.]
MHKVFISYHHANDQFYKESLVTFAHKHRIFIDASVDTGDIPGHLTDERIREVIRDEYLRDSTVTIVLVGTETKCRKHVDWEIYSSMHDGVVNKKSGILAINLPGTSTNFTVSHDGEKGSVYPDVRSWTSVETRAEYESRYPYMPDRLIDNLLEPEAKVSVVPWSRINAARLKFLVDAAFEDRGRCEYDLSRSMRRANS